MNRWIVLKLHGGLGEHAAAWDELLLRRFRPNPMLDSRFVEALLLHFGDGSEHLCILRAGDEIRAMCVLRPRGPGIWTTFLPSQMQIGPVLVNDPTYIPGLMRALPGRTLQLDFLCNDPKFSDYAESKSRAITVYEHALTMSVNLTEGFENYWSSRSKNLVHNIERYERRLLADSICSRFVCITAPSEIHDALARYATLEAKGWKGARGTAITPGGLQSKFYGDVMDRFAQARKAIVFELWLDDRIAASRVALGAADTIVILKTTYDEALRKYSPGRLLLRDVVRHAFATKPGGSIEFYTNANADQLAWSTNKRWISHISFSRGFVAALALSVARSSRLIMSGSPEAGTHPTDDVAVYGHPDELPADVVRLFEKAEVEDMELGLAWYRNLVNTVYPNDDGVCIYVLRRNGAPVAALPIRVAKSAIWQNVEALGNYYTAAYAPVLAPDIGAKDMAKLIVAVRFAHPAVGSMRFTPMNPQSRSYLVLRDALGMAGILTFEFFCFGNWFLHVGGDWAEYLKGRSGTLRNTIKRMGKKFSADGGTLELLRSGAELERGLNAYECVYAASWKSAEPFPDFVPGLVRASAERGWLRLGIAWLQDKPIAAQVWIVVGAKASIYKVAYHEDYKPYAPGTLLTAMLMQHVIDQDRVTEVDYLIGDDPYKKSWMSDRRERWGLIAYNPRSILGLLGLTRELTGRVIKILRSKMKPQAGAASLATNTVDASRAPTPAAKLKQSAKSPPGQILP